MLQLPNKISLVFTELIERGRMARRTPKSCGFTLIELLIVVVILSTLAAIVVPQFTSSSDSARISAAKTNLNGIRSAIAVYRTDKGSYPLANDAKICSGASFELTKETGDAQARLYEALSYYSNSSGEICDTNAEHPQGPYLRAREFPVNPINKSNAISLEVKPVLGITADATGAGWRYQQETGEFIINDKRYENE